MKQRTEIDAEDGPRETEKSKEKNEDKILGKGTQPSAWVGEAAT